MPCSSEVYRIVMVAIEHLESLLPVGLLSRDGLLLCWRQASVAHLKQLIQGVKGYFVGSGFNIKWGLITLGCRNQAPIKLIEKLLARTLSADWFLHNSLVAKTVTIIDCPDG